MHINGWVDRLDVRQIGGWVIDADAPDAELGLSIFLGDLWLGSVPANFDRPDVAETSGIRRNCGFVFRFATALSYDDLPHLRVMVVNGESQLPGDLQSLRGYCAAKFFPYHQKLAYAAVSRITPDLPAEHLILSGDIVLPAGATSPAIRVDDHPPRPIEVGLPTVGRARGFWFADSSDRLGFTCRIATDRRRQRNNISLSFRDAGGSVHHRPLLRIPTEPAKLDIIPPPAQLTRVAAPATTPWTTFVVGGATDVYVVEYLLARYLRRELAGFNAILDWGCGCGRSTWAFAEICPRATMIGVDVDRENLEWARSIVPRGRFVLGALYPPLPIPAGSVDLIYSQSVFTHLSETAQNLWLRELERILAPGGVAVLTAQLEVTALSRAFDLEMIQSYLQAGIQDHIHDPMLAGHISDVGYYRSTFHTSEYVRRHWGQYLDVVAIEPGIVGGHQDAIVCRKK